MLARRSIREFEDREVEQEKIDKILAAASTAPMSIKNGEYVYLQEDGQLTTDRLKAKILGQMEKEVYEKRINLALNYKKAPVAAFSVSLTSGNSPLKVQFTDKSTGSPTSCLKLQFCLPHLQASLF